MPGRPHGWVTAAALVLGSAMPLAAGPVGTAEVLPGGYVAVLDIRDETYCGAASLPGARCLPAEWILDGGQGVPIGFHALRWLFGTVGLSGVETLLVYGGGGGPEDAWAVAGLALLAGQSEVLVWTGSETQADGGESRSFSREAVYTAAMRVEMMAVADAAPRTLRRRLADFARAGGTVDFAPGT